MKEIIIDVRDGMEWEYGHIDNSIHIPLGALNRKLTDLEQYKNDRLIVVCQSGGRASVAVDILEQAGFKNVENGGSWMNFE